MAFICVTIHVYGLTVTGLESTCKAREEVVISVGCYSVVGKFVRIEFFISHEFEKCAMKFIAAAAANDIDLAAAAGS